MRRGSKSPVSKELGRMLYLQLRKRRGRKRPNKFSRKFHFPRFSFFLLWERGARISPFLQFPTTFPWGANEETKLSIFRWIDPNRQSQRNRILLFLLFCENSDYYTGFALHIRVICNWEPVGFWQIETSICGMRSTRLSCSKIVNQNQVVGCLADWLSRRVLLYHSRLLPLLPADMHALKLAR